MSTPTLLKPRQLGHTDIYCSAVGLGCYSMSNAYGQRSDMESVQVIQRAIDKGINLIDTADYYGWGHNEELIASALKGRRSDVVLSSKFGYVPAAGMPFGVCGTPEHVRKACDESLRRLSTDYLDIYFQHRLDPTVPIEETVGAMADLVREGKVRYLGLCEVSESTLRRASEVHPISTVQVEYSLWSREVEERMLNVFSQLQVTPMAFSPLARGMLTGQIRSLDQLQHNDVRRFSPRFQPDNFTKNLELIDELGEIAQANGIKTSQLAIAWLLHKSPSVLAICGSDTLDFLEENLEALAIELPDALLEQISQLFLPGRVHGDRYPPVLMQMLDR